MICSGERLPGKKIRFFSIFMPQNKQDTHIIVNVLLPVLFLNKNLTIYMV